MRHLRLQRMLRRCVIRVADGGRRRYLNEDGMQAAQCVRMRGYEENKQVLHQHCGEYVYKAL
jgi:hypothetical protein